jgi:predicted short-subunit dehydrogenase-like oxidoreductase (DUF2520 family)
MSTSPELKRAPRPDDQLVTVISRWLARHVDDDELRRTLAATGTAELEPGQAEAVEELVAELERGGANRSELEMVARETLEAVALGG